MFYICERLVMLYFVMFIYAFFEWRSHPPGFDYSKLSFLSTLTFSQTVCLVLLVLAGVLALITEGGAHCKNMIQVKNKHDKAWRGLAYIWVFLWERQTWRICDVCLACRACRRHSHTDWALGLNYDSRHSHASSS